MIDFIVTLLPCSGYNSLLTVTDKFSKQMLLILGHETYDTEQWAVALLTTLLKADWGIPCCIISNCDTKFISMLWRTWFTQLGTKLLMSMLYHPQTDRQSEQSNQMVEIALCYLTTTMDMPWVDTLPCLQHVLNNSLSVLTKHSPNKIVYRFKTNFVETGALVDEEQ